MFAGVRILVSQQSRPVNTRLAQRMRIGLNGAGADQRRFERAGISNTRLSRLT